MEGEPQTEASLFPTTVGEKLRGAREAQGLELAEIARRTRIPQRHLEAIERSSYGSLPSITYAIGFAKSYARAVGADEVAIGREVRAELGSGSHERTLPIPSYEMTDPTRTPPRGLVWTGVVVALLVLAGAGIWYGTGWFRGTAPAPEALVTEDAPPEQSSIPGTEPSPAATGAAGGQVSLVALDTVWVRVVDAKGNRLFEKEMLPGERYDVPPDADRPVATTGRADSIQVMLNGSNVAPLGPPRRTVEAEVSAAALLARNASGSGAPDNATEPANATAP